MPDHTPIGTDTLVIDMVAAVRHGTARPGRCGAGEGRRDRAGDHPRTGRTRHLRRDHAGAVGRLGARPGDLCAAAGGDRRRRRLGVHHGQRAQLADLHHLRPVRHGRAEGSLAAPTGDRRGGGLVRADRAAGGIGCVEPEDARGEEGRPLHHQRRQAVHHLGAASRAARCCSPSPIRRPGARASRASWWTRRRRDTRWRGAEEKLGQKASETCALAFQDMEVPEDQRIGAEGEGYKIALSTLESGRIGIAAQSVGMARAALDYAVAVRQGAAGVRRADHRLPGGGVPAGGGQDQAGGGAADDAVRRAAEGGGRAGAGGGVHGKAVRRPRRRRRCAPRQSRRWAAMGTWRTIRWSGSIATSGCARSMRARRTCRS